MRLSKIIRQARNGELKALSPGDKTDEVVIDYINLAMIALYSKFQLKTDEAIIELSSARTLYKLNGEDTAVRVDGQIKTEDDVMQLIGAYDEKGPIAINNEHEPYSIYQTSYNTVQVPMPEDGAYVGIIYKAGPEDIVYTDSGDGSANDQEVALPMQLLEALLHYVGYRAHGSLDGAIDAENNTHLMRFKASCDEAIRNGVIPADSLEMTNDRKGFVL